jgi:hypothetical protein
MYDSDFEYKQGQEIFLFFSKSLRPAVRPTQPLIQWEPVAHSWGVKWLDREIYHILLSSTEVKNEWSCTPLPPICSHDENRNKYLLFVF